MMLQANTPMATVRAVEVSSQYFLFYSRFSSLQEKQLTTEADSWRTSKFQENVDEVDHSN